MGSVRRRLGSSQPGLWPCRGLSALVPSPCSRRRGTDLQLLCAAFCLLDLFNAFDYLFFFAMFKGKLKFKIVSSAAMKGP